MNKIKSIFNFLIWSAIVFVAIFTAARVYITITDNFSYNDITYQVQSNPNWNIAELSPNEKTNLSNILSQKYHYIGKGAQSYAFTSEDNQYVLKFFKFKHLKPSFLVDLLPSVSFIKPYIDEHKAYKQSKMEGVFNGYKLSYDIHKDDSGLIFVHLNPTTYLQQQVTITDKVGLSHQIDLDTTVFLLQKKGITTRNTMIKLLEDENVSAVNKAITQIMNMYVSEYQKGIYDRDHGVMHNTGFIDGQPFHLDVGKMTKDDSMRDQKVYKNDLKFISWKMDTWVKMHCKTLYPQISAHIANEYHRLTNDNFYPDQIKLSDFKNKKQSLLF